MRTHRAVLSAVFVLAAAGAVRPQGATTRPPGATGTVLVPEEFLRRWDPVTVFFLRDVGPAGGGAEDEPGRWVRFTPEHPGAFTWLDARTLQFRPAEPWPPLARFHWRVEGKSIPLATLMAAPVASLPANEAVGLDPVESVTLTFSEPLDPVALSRMTTIELRPLPGVGAGGERYLTGEDFRVKPIERRSRSDYASYVLALGEPIPLGTRAIVHLRLSLDDRGAPSFARVDFATAEPFRAVGAGCREQRYPLTREGSRYSRDQSLRCDPENRAVTVQFSAAPRALGPVEARNLVRFTPAVDNLSFSVEDRTLRISGNFVGETLYRVNLVPAAVWDTTGRPLDMAGESEIYLYFPPRRAYLQWGASQGVVERFGPQMVPISGRAQERMDLRIHRVDPLDRSFWPFPDRPVTVDESRRPPGPGETPPPFDGPAGAITPAQLAEQISALGSPPVSTLVSLPLRREGSSASFGLDIEPHLTRISGKGRPGTFLVGLRRLDGSSERSWLRIQVTDLSLSALEGPKAVRFAVTSLSTGKPMAGAGVRVEGAVRESGSDPQWTTLAEGVTSAEGSFDWQAPGDAPHRVVQVKRIVVAKGEDTLVLDPARPPDGFRDNNWSQSREGWLQWTQEPLGDRGPQPEDLCHIFTERPVYRPEEEVHVKGYVRRRQRGGLTPLRFDGFVVVNGPGDLEWRYTVSLTEAGSFYHRFAEAKLPTGVYHARLEDRDGDRYGDVAWRMEAYRIPLFEVELHAPDRTPLDREFEVSLTANYYAGGRVAARPVAWRVTQFPYAWTPKRQEGFFYSSDGRFSRTGRFQASPAVEQQGVTDEQGSASLVINPAIEPTADPRSYVVEATVTGPDDQTVTATRQVLALPPFVLGLKAPRFLERATAIEPEILVLGLASEPIAGKEVTVRLLHRQWHSILRASDFSDGVARYTTDVVDEKVLETKVVSGEAPVTVSLPVARAGVYVVELEAHDRLERAQVVSVDLYAGGDEPVTWSRPVSRVFTTSTDKENYNPGETAAIVLQSPFQRAEALAVVEAPEGNLYRWVSVEGGAATFSLPIRGTYVPQVPVHFVLMRGRLAGTAPVPGSTTDLGKPATLASTAWVKVNPVEHRVEVKLEHPEKATPGERIPVKIQLSDPQGNPRPGEVTLWLVDQAVLALGKEQRLDPVPDFITPVVSHLTVRDTRNLAFGYLPFQENPGGGGEEEEPGVLDRATVRRTFKTVPYYDPGIAVGPDGTVTVTVDLPDNLTVFKVRAKAASGADRFGFGTGQVAVRLPVIVQPALPRFVRPGDSFTAAAIGRVVEGEGGPGAAEVRTTGVRLSGESRRDLNWVPNSPLRIEFPVEVTTPAYTAEGELSYREVTFRVGVERASDGARDAFEVKLPLQEDRQRVTARLLEDLVAGKSLALPAVSEPARPGTLRRTLLASDQPGLVRMAAGLDFLMQYPYGCTEQRLARARVQVALKQFRSLLKQEGADEEIDRAVRDTLEWIQLSVDSNGLVAYWPGSAGYVSLTAWVVQFLIEAKDAHFPVSEEPLNTLTRSLEQALRSDYGRFIDGESWAERSWALSALATAGRFNSAYAAELARGSQYLDLEGVAQVLLAFTRAGQAGSATGQGLSKELWDGLVVRLHQGREIYGGLQRQARSRNALILPSETRALAEVTRSLSRLPANPRLQVLINGLVTLGRGDGWGTTNANASALLALSDVVKPPFAGSSPHSLQVRLDGQAETLSLGPSSPVAHLVSASAGAGEVTLASGRGPVVVRAETSYVPSADGSAVAPHSQGFVVTRGLLRVRGEGQAPERIPLAEAGKTVEFSIGDVIEEHVQVVNPKERHYVAVVVPLAAGMEPLNPNLATAPPEARAAGRITLEPTYVAFMDDHVAFYYNQLRQGTLDFYFRTRATIAGRFIQPAARAEMMYDGAVRGNSAGARIAIVRREQ